MVKRGIKKYRTITVKQQVPISNKSSGVFLAFEYLAGLLVFGLIFLFLDDITNLFHNILGDGGELDQLAMYLWGGCLVVYLIFGIFWFISSLKEWEVYR